MREKVLTVTRDDCKWHYFVGTGNGGQKRNKTASCVRVTHPPSGAIGESREERSQWQNRKTAWKRLCNSVTFRRWVNEQALNLISEEEMQHKIDSLMGPESIKIEVKRNGIWVTE